MNNRIIRLAFLFLVFLLSAAFVQADLSPGDVVPDFELTDMEGLKVRLSDYRGHPFILKLATTWCPSCKQQSAEFIKAKKFLTENKIPVIEVFVDDTESEVRTYMKKHPLHDPHATVLDDGQVYKAYNVYLIPRVLIVDRDFRVRRDGSVIEAARFKTILQELL